MILVDLITCSQADLTMNAGDLYGDFDWDEPDPDVRRQQVRTSRYDLNSWEIPVLNRPKKYKLGGMVIPQRFRLPRVDGGTPMTTDKHPGDLAVGSGQTYCHRFPNRHLFNDETPRRYRYHAEVLGLTAGVQLIDESGGMGEVIALGIAGRRGVNDNFYTKQFCPELCQEFLRRCGFNLSANLRCASLPGVPTDLRLEARAQEIHARKGVRAQANEVTCVTRVELYDQE